MTASAARIEQARRLGPRGRIVQHATLHTGAADAVAPLRSALEDALATADFGDCGRLVLVRRLQLQHLPHQASPVQLARALEAAWRALATHAMPHHHPQAAQAPAVYFASRFEARLAWLQRVAGGLPTADWFWPAALPELALPAPPAHPVDRVAALLREEAPEAARQALTGWPDGDLIALAQALSPATLDAWRSQLQTTSATPTPIETRAGATPSAPTGQTAAAVCATARRLPPVGTVAPSATAWLAALWLAPALQRPPTPGEVAQVLALQPARAAGPDARVSVTGPATAAPAPPPTVRAPALTRSMLTEDVGPPNTPGHPVAPSGRSPHPHPTGTSPVTRPPDGSPTPQAAAPGPHTAVAPTAIRPHRLRTPSALPWLADAAPSAHAGLMLLLNVLQAMRFDAWLRDHPAGAQRPFVHALLRQLLDHCSAPEHDPQRTWLACNDAEQRTLATARWDGGHRSTAQALRGWWLRLRRALRRHVGPDLRDVVVRDGWLGASATHIDVVYPLDEVALPLRRRGLDADPGWVPWFGHIVAFHFVPREQLPVPGEGDHGG